MRSIELEFEYFILIYFENDYMYKSTNIETIEELAENDLDLVYGVKTVRGERLAFYLEREHDGTYVQARGNDFRCIALVYLLRDFQPLVNVDLPGRLDRIRKCRLDVFEYYIFSVTEKRVTKIYKTSDRQVLDTCRGLVWGVVNEFGRDRAYLLNVPKGGWPTIKQIKLNSIGVDYLKASYGTIMEF